MEKTNVSQSSHIGQDDNELTIAGLLTGIGTYKRYIFLATSLGIIVGLAVALLSPKIFTAKTTLLPPQQSAAGSLASSLGALSALAGSAGGMKSTDELYVALLKSDSVVGEIAKMYDLQNLYKRDTITAARKQLAESTRISSEKKSGLITVEVDQGDPDLASKLANSYVDELRRILTRVSVTEAQQRQAYYKQQAEQAKNSVTRAELALKQAKDQSGILSLDAQAQASIVAAAQLRAQMVAKEVQLQAMRSFAGPENTDYKRLTAEILSIKSELGKIEGESDRTLAGDFRESIRSTTQENPAMSTVRLMRDLKFNETVYTAMLQQYTIATADVSKEAPLVQQIDIAVPPELKSKPKRVTIVAIATIVGFLLGILAAFVRSTVTNSAQNPASVERMRALKSAWSFRRTA